MQEECVVSSPEFCAVCLLAERKQNGHVEGKEGAGVGGQHHRSVARAGQVRHAYVPAAARHRYRTQNPRRHTQPLQIMPSHCVGGKIVDRRVHVAALSAGKQLVDDGWGVDGAVPVAVVGFIQESGCNVRGWGGSTCPAARRSCSCPGWAAMARDGLHATRNTNDACTPNNKTPNPYCI